MRLVSRSAITLAAMAAAPVAAAVPQPASETVTVRIGFADIDINSAEGRAALKERVEVQLREACMVKSDLRYRTKALDERCVKEARTIAFAQVERLAQTATASRGVAAR